MGMTSYCLRASFESWRYSSRSILRRISLWRIPDFPEVDRERQGALEDIQPLLLGLPEGHEDRCLVAGNPRQEEQHQDIPGPVGRAAQVAGKTVREVRDPRFLPVGFEVFDTLDHQLRQSGCYGIYQIMVFHGWMGLERLKTGAGDPLPEDACCRRIGA